MTQGRYQPEKNATDENITAGRVFGAISALTFTTWQYGMDVPTTWPWFAFVAVMSVAGGEVARALPSMQVAAKNYVSTKMNAYTPSFVTSMFGKSQAVAEQKEPLVEPKKIWPKKAF